MEGDPGGQRGPTHAVQRHRQRRLRRTEDDHKQRVHHRQEKRGGTRHALPVSEAY